MGTVYTELAAPVTMGRIQVGAEFGGSAIMIVPAVCVPVAMAGTLPNCPCRPMLPEPDVLVPVALLLLLLLLQAASAVMLATVRASAPMLFFPNVFIAPPSLRGWRLWSVLGSSACR